MSKHQQKQIDFFLLFLSLCGAFSFFVTIPQQTNPEAWTLVSILREIRYSFDGVLIQSSVFSICFYCFSKKTCFCWKHKAWTIVLSIIIAFFWLCSLAASTSETMSNTLLGTPAQFLKSLLYVVGMSFFVFLSGQFLYLICTKQDNSIENGTLTSGTDFKWFHRHSFWGNVIILLLAWIPYLILDFPARLAWDSWRELSMFFGKLAFTAHDPPAHTILIGLFAKLGLALGNVNLGFLLFVLLQMISGSLIIAFEIDTMKKLNAPNWMCKMTLLASMISTPIAYYSVEILKDCQYVHFFLLMTVCFALLLKNPVSFLDDRMKRFLFSISIFGVLLFRKNGKYIVFILFLAALFWLIVKIAKNGFSFLKVLGVRSFVMLLLPVLLANITVYCFISYYDIGEASIREAFSLPFQQTARYVKFHSDEISLEEANTINAVIDYDSLAELYNPTNVDPVKRTFKEDVSVEDLIEYFKVWANQFIIHPETYFAATINQTYALYYPFRESVRTRYGIRNEEEFEELISELGYKVDTFIPAGNEIARWIGIMVYRIPIIGLLSNQAIYTLVVVFLLMYAVLDKKSKCLWLITPLALSVLVVFLAPIVIDHDRYAFPFIYSMPVFLAFFHDSYNYHPSDTYSNHSLIND